MFSQSRKISLRLVLLAVALSLHHADGRSVMPVTFGYELGTPFRDALSAVPDDLTIAAAEPRPVFVELVKRPLSLPLVADAATVSDAASEAPAISASEKIEKILRTPMAFSFNNDQAHAASDVIVNSPKDKLEAVESRHKLDQQPEAIDYYKYLARLQDEAKDEGASSKKESSDHKKEESASDKQEVAKEKKDSSDIRHKSKPHIFLSHSPSHFYEDFAKPAVEFQKSEDHESKQKSEDSKDSDHEAHADHHHYHHQHDEAKPADLGGKAEPADLGGKAEATESHEENKAESHESGQQSATEEVQKEEVQASASDHGGGGGGGGHGGDGNYKKGGGKEYKSILEGEHGEIGEKKYSGHHHHEKGEKGHKDKDDHINEYEEAIGHKDGHHEEDGYEAEHQHGEEGKRGTQFHEEGEHSKGHSTQGEHNIHKKDEYEKKQEFYDESHEGGEHEKHGEYFHEDDYHKGGHHKSGHHKGGEHEEHYGKQKEFEEGGHESKGNGHKKAIGREVHHDHEQKEGEESKQQGGKKWEYENGSGNGGGDDNKGAHQQQVQVVAKDGKTEASDHGKQEEEDSKGADYHVIEITNEKKPLEGLQSDDNGHLVQATELHKQFIEEYKYGGGNIDHEQGKDNVDVGASNHNPVHDADQVQNARLQEAGAGHAQAEKSQNYYGHLFEAETRPQQAEQQPANDQENGYGPDSNAYNSHLHAQSEPHSAHVHENGQICPGSTSSPAASEHVPQVAQPEDSSYESHAQGEESAPHSHILVVGSDGSIYGVLTNDGLIDAAA